MVECAERSGYPAEELPVSSGNSRTTGTNWAWGFVDTVGSRFGVTRHSQRGQMTLESVPGLISLIMVVGCSILVFAVMNPALILSDTVPTGGDMGAHVWGPAYLRDELLPNLQLSGWSPDWYAGFPAYHFYMVVPALAIVALNAGITPSVGVPISILLIAAINVVGRRFDIRRRYLVALSLLVATLLISLPYGTSFKLITVAGVVLFPISVWFLARMAKAPQPLPLFLAMGGTVFLFDASFWILGGNIMSTLAGEFSHSISLTVSFFAMGLVFRGLEEGRLRARSAIVIALVALCHIIPLFFLVIMLGFIVALGKGASRVPLVALATIVSLVLFLVGPNTAGIASTFRGTAGTGADSLSTMAAVVGVVIATTLLVASTVLSEELRQRIWWLTTAGVVGALLSMFWLLPFWYQGGHFNDMGWNRLNDIGSELLTTPMTVCIPIAVVGAVTSFVIRDRIGMLFTASAVVSLSAVANLPQGALWNERILPFFYLSIYLLTAVAVASWLRALASWKARDFDRPSSPVLISGSFIGFAVLLAGLSMPMRTLPLGQLQADGSYSWGVFTSTEQTKVSSWSRWNYAGYEGHGSYAEYHHVITTMDEIGKTTSEDGSDGCGRAMWEFDESLDRYGTPMALMLLPHWTDGCIGSMEGLFFESSATTPFHFLNQTTMSQNPSQAQRELPYAEFDIDVGVAQLQTMGVRYYMALTDESIEAAREHQDLSEVAEAAPFVVFEVAGSELVEGLEFDPVIVKDFDAATDEAGDNGDTSDADDATSEEPDDRVAIPEEVEELSRFEKGWLSQAIEYYGDPEAYDVLPAEDGPDSWQESTTLDVKEPTERDPVEVTDIEVGRDSISFEVDNLNEPVLVKVSHFPNWKVSGAEGPYRVGPNLMAVIPTSNKVSMSYSRNAIDWFAIFLTVAGAAGVGLLIRLDRNRRRRTQLASAAPGAETWAIPVSPPEKPAEGESSTEAEAEKVGFESVPTLFGAIPIPAAADTKQPGSWFASGASATVGESGEDVTAISEPDEEGTAVDPQQSVGDSDDDGDPEGDPDNDEPSSGEADIVGEEAADPNEALDESDPKAPTSDEE